MEEMHGARYGKGLRASLPSPGIPPSPNIHVLTDVEALWTLSFKSLGGGLVTKLCPTLVTPWTVACQAPLSMGFSRQEYWSGLPFLSPGDLPDPGIELASSALTNRFSALASNSFLYHLATRVDPTSFVHAQLLSHVWLFAIPWTVTHKTHLSMRPPLLVSDWLRSSMRTVALQAHARWFH